jgi:Conjugal transfer protein
LQYLAYAGLIGSFIAGLKYRNSGGVYLAMLGILLSSVVFMFGGCATQPPPPPPVVAVAPPPPKPQIPDDPYVGLPSDVADAIRSNQTPTFRHGITLVWPYSADLQYPLNCQPLHVTQIRLAPDETTDKNNVKVGDKNRWGTIIGKHTVLIFPLGTNVSITVPGAQQTIPAAPHMETNLVIATNKGHQYVLNPVRIGKPFTEAVEWYYSDEVRAQYAARQAALKEVQ